MTQNHLVIGLGGTGGKIIRALRKTIYQEFRKDSPNGVNVGYLYVDSSDEMMRLDDPTWKILGTSVQLDKKSQLLIQDANLGARLDSINEYPGIKPWIGPTEQWRDILGSIVGATLGGQKRRLGRFLFACKVADFKNQVGSIYRDLTRGGSGDVTFHVVTGLAGGTGSGSLIDVISQVRDAYADSRRFKIIVYALLPETFPNPNWDTGNYHANGYAALAELNAASVGRYKPVDISGVKPGRLEPMDPFNGCYVFTNENDNGLTVDVDKQLPGVMADFLYQKIIAAGEVSWPVLGRMENAENGDGSPEKAPGTNTPERAKRFLTFGIKRLAIPEDEIAEYLTYSFARQSALQVRYNNWSDTSGFMDEPRNVDFHELVSLRDTWERWMITDAHLTLSTGILPEDTANKRWKPINNEWQDVIPNLKSLVREHKTETWLDELSKLCEKRFDQDYRGVGVRNFYKLKLKSKKEHVAEVRRQIETELFADWKNGVKSASEISRLLAALIESVEERLKIMDDKVVAMKNNEAEAANEVAANNQAFKNVGLIGKALNRHENLLNAQGEALHKQYAYRTWIEAWSFAKQLTAELVQELSNLKADVDQSASTIAEAVKKYNQRIGERVNDGGTTDARQQLIRFYDPAKVKALTASLVKDENEQRTQTGKVRLALIGQLGDSASFELFNQRITIAGFLDVLDKESANNARIAHNNFVQNPKDRVLGVSIIEKLKERYAGNNQELKAFLTDLVSHAGNFVSLDWAEIDKERATAQTAVKQLTVILPKAPEHADFVNLVKDLFRGASTSQVEFVESDVKRNEITLVNMVNLFPLRYVKQVGLLRQKYDLRVNGPTSARARLELHTEGDGTQFPLLFIPSQGAVARDTIPYLLLAKAIGLVQEMPNAQTGAKELALVTKDQSGLDTDPILLGRALTDAPGKLDRRESDLVREYVRLALASPDLMLDAKRTDLLQSVVAQVDAIKIERGGNMQDETYRQFLEGGKKAVAILKREA
jgi:hypothetical protein